MPDRPDAKPTPHQPIALRELIIKALAHAQTDDLMIVSATIAHSYYGDRLGINVLDSDGRTWRIQVLLDPIDPTTRTVTQPRSIAQGRPPVARCGRCGKRPSDHGPGEHAFERSYRDGAS